MIETPDIYVRVSRELLELLDDWSAPVEARIVKVGDGYDMTFRTHTCETLWRVAIRVVGEGADRVYDHVRSRSADAAGEIARAYACSEVGDPDARMHVTVTRSA